MHSAFSRLMPHAAKDWIDLLIILTLALLMVDFWAYRRRIWAWLSASRYRLVALIVACATVTVYAASSKLTALTSATSLLVTDIMYAVTDPGGTPASKKATVQVVGDSLIPDEAIVYNSGNESIPNGVTTAITFDSEKLDTNGMHSTSTNTSRMTAIKAGVYTATCSLQWPANTTGTRIMVLTVNGTTVVERDLVPNLLTTQDDALTMPDQVLNANDYIECQVYQNITGGGALNINATTASSPFFSARRVSK